MGLNEPGTTEMKARNQLSRHPKNHNIQIVYMIMAPMNIAMNRANVLLACALQNPFYVT